MRTLGASDIDKALGKIGDQPDRKAHADSILSRICTCSGNNSIPTDLRVASILRLLGIDSRLVYSNDHRRHLVRLIQERLEETHPRVLHEYKITPSTQADELCRRLSHIVEDAHNELSKALDIYDGLDTLPRFRQRLLQTLNSSRCDTVIMPFLDLDGDITEILNRCLGRVIDYLQADVYDARNTYDSATDSLSWTLRAFEVSPTSIGRPLSDLIGDLRTDLGHHAQDNPHLQPANIKVNADLRRHPLHEPELHLTIPVEVINDSVGTAADLDIRWIDAIGLTDLGPAIRLQSVGPGRMIVEMTATTDPTSLESDQEALCEFAVSWANGDGSDGDYHSAHFLKTQDTNVDWTRLKRTNPYSLEAVRKPTELVGRTQILDRIISTLNTDTVGSLYIHGEKRVGKTSLAQVALTILEQDYGMSPLYIDIGEVHNTDPTTVINNLARQIIDRVKPFQTGIRFNEERALDGTLAPLIELLRNVVRTQPARRIVIAIDEFDRLPRPLLQRTTEADNFFLGLRTLSSIKGIGLVLIGAERMKLILNGPGVELNRFSGFPVDYIERSTQWSEFKELVQAPTKDALEFTDQACDLIYSYTQGNPFYTKYLCAKLLDRAAQRRDAFIDHRDVEAGVEHLLEEMDAVGFSHYWEDFVLGDEKARVEAAVNRRLCLLAYGQAADNNGEARISDIVNSSSNLGQAFEDTHNTLDEFVDRKILVRDSGNSIISPRVMIFGRWIKGRGQDHIIFAMDEHDAVRRSIKLRTANRVSIREADKLVDGWSVYNGTRISGERLLAFLRQFGDEHRQKLIYLLLKGIRFIGVAEEQKLLREAYEILGHNMKAIHGKWRRDQIGVSYADSPAKSIASMGKAFARVNSLLVKDHFISPRRLVDKRQDGITDVVIVDDFVGTGKTMCSAIEKLSGRLATDQALHVFAIAGLDDGLCAVEELGRSMLGPDLFKVHVLQGIRSYPWPFRERSGLFPSKEVADEAYNVVLEVGSKLEPRIPLGYGDGCALVVFSHTIPNNAPPILWSAASGRFSFEPLFQRHYYR